MSRNTVPDRFSKPARRRSKTFGEMTDLPKALREKLSERRVISTLRVESRYVSKDGTRRFLMKTHDNLPVETVFIPDRKPRHDLFFVAVGLPSKCDFCLTAKLGLLRNLTAGEIVEQIIIVLNDVYGAGAETPHGTNLVGDGRGRAVFEFREFDQGARNNGGRRRPFYRANRVTISTAGIVPKIYEFASSKNARIWRFH
jgi:23S rRNA (adenine2503-C2)-methyltransferase